MVTTCFVMVAEKLDYLFKPVLGVEFEHRQDISLTCQF